jgi:hypothetical protein
MEKLREAGRRNPPLLWREERAEPDKKLRVGTDGFEVVRTDQLGPAEGGQASGQPALSFPAGSGAGRDRDTQGAVLPRAQPCHAWHCHAWLCIALHSIAMLCNRLGRMAPLGEDPIRPVGVGVRWPFPWP